MNEGDPSTEELHVMRARFWAQTSKTWVGYLETMDRTLDHTFEFLEPRIEVGLAGPVLWPGWRGFFARA